MHFELWETRSGNAIGEYDSEDAALVVVRDTVQVHGRSAATSFALVSVNTRGRAKTVASGEALTARAFAGESDPVSRPSRPAMAKNCSSLADCHPATAAQVAS